MAAEVRTDFPQKRVDDNNERVLICLKKKCLKQIN